MELTELQKTQAAYAHFTLDEWTLLSFLCRRESNVTENNARYDLLQAILVKFPSAVL